MTPGSNRTDKKCSLLSRSSESTQERSVEGGKSCKYLNAWGEEGPKMKEKHKEIEGKWEKSGRGT